MDPREREQTINRKYPVMGKISQTWDYESPIDDISPGWELGV